MTYPEVIGLTPNHELWMVWKEFPLLYLRSEMIFNKSEDDPDVLNLLKQAVGTSFNLENNQKFIGPDATSFREQISSYLLGLDTDPEEAKTILGRKLNQSHAIFFDSIKQEGANTLGNVAGDRYILANLESTLQWGQDNNYTVIVGRYSGDEMLALLIPNDEPLTTESIQNCITQANYDFFYGKDRKPKDRWVKTDQAVKALYPEYDLGAKYKIDKLTNIPKLMGSEPSKIIRERALLTSIIDGIEHSINLADTSENLVQTIMDNLTTARHLKDVSWEELVKVLPPSITQLVKNIQAKNTGIAPEYLFALAEDATFESIFNRRTVYKEHHLAEIIQTLNESGKDFYVGRAANTLIKNLNQVSHILGDMGIVNSAEKLQTKIGELTLVKDKGSFILLMSGDTLAKITRKQTEDPNFLNGKDDDTTFMALTLSIWDEDNQKMIPIKVTKDSSTTEINRYVELTKKEQIANEVMAYFYAMIQGLISYEEYIRQYQNLRTTRIIAEKDLHDYSILVSGQAKTLEISRPELKKVVAPLLEPCWPA